MRYDRKVQYTQELLNLSDNSKKVVKIRAFGLQKARGTEDRVEPYRNANGSWLGIKHYTSEERKDKPYLPRIPVEDALIKQEASHYVLKDGATFDLNNEEQRLTWEWIQYSPLVGYDTDDCTSDLECKYYIDQSEKKEVEAVEKKRKKGKVYMFIEKYNKLSDKRRYAQYLLNKRLTDFTETKIDDLLYDAVENTAFLNNMLKDLEDADLQYKTIIKDLEYRGDVYFKAIDMIYFETGTNIPIGSQESFIRLLKDKHKDETLNNMKKRFLETVGL